MFSEGICQKKKELTCCSCFSDVYHYQLCLG